MRVVRGLTSLSISSHLLPIEDSKLVNPVVLPPGRAQTLDETAADRIGNLDAARARAKYGLIERRAPSPSQAMVMNRPVDGTPALSRMNIRYTPGGATRPDGGGMTCKCVASAAVNDSST